MSTHLHVRIPLHLLHHLHVLGLLVLGHLLLLLLGATKEPHQHVHPQLNGPHGEDIQIEHTGQGCCSAALFSAG
jgi:hypothetical protein